MISSGINSASSTYLRLKDRLGHYHNRDRRPSIDDHHGERHRSMIELQEHLGQIGTPTHEIEKLMGVPTKILDQPDDLLLYELKRNNQQYQFPSNAKIWIYEWRSNHDFVYFIISNENKVLQSAWYYSFE